jgi:hypothetical protein
MQLRSDDFQAHFYHCSGELLYASLRLGMDCLRPYKCHYTTNLRMGYIKTKAGQKSSENVKIAKMFHQLTCFCKVVKIPCNFYYASDIVVSILLVRRLFDSS